MSSTSSNTTGVAISLKFVVVGGGIAGLATAYTLKRAGHSVVVLEKRDVKSMNFGSGGSIRAPPSMINLLYRWGLGPVLNEKGHKCNKLVYLNGNSGDMLGCLALDENVIKALIYDMLLIQHGDLLNILYDLAIREGVEIRQNSNVIHADANAVSVRLSTGETISGDIIIAADGYASWVRSTMMECPQGTGLESTEKVLYIAFTVEINLLNNDESFKSVLESTDWITWIAEDTITHTHVVNGGKHLLGVMSHNYNGSSKEGDEEWSDARDLESYGLDFTALEPRLQKFLKLSKTVVSRIFLKIPLPEDLVNERSSIVLVGDAAHPIMQSEAIHGIALAFEDAETLGSLFSRIQCREQIKQLLTAYEEIRYPRCAQTSRYCESLDARLKSPMGPQQEARDVLIRQTLTYCNWDDIDEETFQSVWGDQLSMFAYDANEAIDDWWAKWGSFISSGKNLPSRPVSTGMQVWVSKEGWKVRR